MVNTFAAEIPCKANKKITAKQTSNRIRDSLRASIAAGPSILEVGAPEGVEGSVDFWSYRQEMNIELDTRSLL